MGKKHRSYYFKQEKKDVPTKWSVGESPKACVNCDFLGNGKFTILIHPEVYGAIFALTEKIKVEWQMLLTGDVQDKTVYCNGYYVPKQETTHSTVKNLDCIDEEFCTEQSVVVAMHSHGSMAVFFSSEDEEKTNHTPFIKHFITVNNAHEMVAKSRHDLPCGMVKFVEATVQVMIPTLEKVEGIERITQRKYEHTSSFFGNGVDKDFYETHVWSESQSKFVERALLTDEKTWKPQFSNNARKKEEKFVPWWLREEDEFVQNEHGIWVEKSHTGTSTERTPV